MTTYTCAECGMLTRNMVRTWLIRAQGTYGYEIRFLCESCELVMSIIKNLEEVTADGTEEASNNS